MTTIEIDRTYPHPRERVWRALTDPELLARWLMPNDFEPRVGHRFTFRTDPGPGFDGVVHCEVTEIEEPRLVAFTWVGGPLDTRVRFTLEEVPGGTRLQVEHSGFRGLKAWLVSRILKAGSRTIYGRKLPAVLESMDAPAPENIEVAECMTPGQGLVRRLLALFERKTR